jgi:hypothetical protein
VKIGFENLISTRRLITFHVRPVVQSVSLRVCNFKEHGKGVICSTGCKECNTDRVLVRKSERKNTTGRTWRRWGILLKWILKKRDERAWTLLTRLKIGTDGQLLLTR